MAVKVEAQWPYVVDYVELCDESGCRKIPRERFEEMTFPGWDHVGLGIKFTITSDTTVIAHIASAVTAVVKVNVKSVGTPPTTITATYSRMLVGEKLIGEKIVESPGVYEIGRVELPPGTYVIKATATDSAGRTATAEKTFNV